MTQNDLMSELEQQALVDINEARDTQALQEVEVKYLGEKGSVNSLMKNMRDLPNEDKPAYDQKINELRRTIQSELDERRKLIKEERLNRQFSEKTIDVTLPSRHIEIRSKHPLTRIVEEIEDLFLGLSYEIIDGYEVEQGYYNFETLNLLRSHPAHDMQGSFYIAEEILMRTHTSPVQTRTMGKCKEQEPIKIICPGKVCRRGLDDAAHSYQFTQIEGLVVDKDIKVGGLKGALELVAKKLFGADREIRLHPGHSLFTEPSIEVDVSCFERKGQGCNVYKHAGWIEILGAGMVHPNVLEMAGFNSKEHSGFAFDMGPDRVTMLKYGIEGIHHFYTDDVRFLDQLKAVENRSEQ